MFGRDKEKLPAKIIPQEEKKCRDAIHERDEAKKKPMKAYADERRHTT